MHARCLKTTPGSKVDTNQRRLIFIFGSSISKLITTTRPAI
jgi:hypothetical protein